MPNETPFLRLKPDAQAATLLLAIDVDGVLNKFGPESRDHLPLITWSEREAYRVDIDPKVVQESNRVVRNPQVSLVWLTSWSTKVALLEQLFDRRLRGGFVLAEPPRYRVSMKWKGEALKDHLERAGRNQPFVWIDDELPAAAASRPELLNAPNSLLIQPWASVGLTLEHVASIAEFVELHTCGTDD